MSSRCNILEVIICVSLRNFERNPTSHASTRLKLCRERLVFIFFSGGLWVECAAELIAEVDANYPTETADCNWPGEVIAAAMYTLNSCPVHSRYIRKGLGEHKPLEKVEFMMTSNEVRNTLTMLRLFPAVFGSIMSKQLSLCQTDLRSHLFS